MKNFNIFGEILKLPYNENFENNYNEMLKFFSYTIKVYKKVAKKIKSIYYDLF